MKSGEVFLGIVCIIAVAVFAGYGPAIIGALAWIWEWIVNPVCHGLIIAARWLVETWHAIPEIF